MFDQGLGDIFSIRIAGNFVNEDILGSMEFSCKIAGSKLVVVLGHTGCGAIKGVCDNVRMGHLTTVLTKLRGALDETEDPTEDRSSQNLSFVNNVAATNVKLTMEDISERSTILRDLMDEGTIGLVGGMYDVNTGTVEFYE